MTAKPVDDRPGSHWLSAQTCLLGELFDLLAQLQPALFQCVQLIAHRLEPLAGFSNFCGWNLRGQLFFQLRFFCRQRGHFFVYLLQLFFQRLGFFRQLLARLCGQTPCFTLIHLGCSRVLRRCIGR